MITSKKRRLLYSNLAEKKQSLSENQIQQLIDLNHPFSREVGELTPSRILYFQQIAPYFLLASSSGAQAQIMGFAIAITSPSRFAQPFFSWFSEQYEHFLFLERIVIHPDYQRDNVASTLITPLISESYLHQIPLSLAINHIPPNLPALNFALSRLLLSPLQQDTCDHHLSVTYFSHTFSEQEHLNFSQTYTPKIKKKKKNILRNSKKNR